MVVITIETCKNAKVDTIQGKNKKIFWMKMKGRQDGLGIKSMCDLLKNKCVGFLILKTLLKNKKGNM